MDRARWMEVARVLYYALLALLTEARRHPGWFLLVEARQLFSQRQGFELAAALAFYGLIALLPFILLCLFALSHVVVASGYTEEQLAEFASIVLPQAGDRVMAEVYNLARQQRVWGIFGLAALLGMQTPLASGLNAAFRQMAGLTPRPSFLHRKLLDLATVLCILLLFTVFTWSGLVINRLLTVLEDLPFFLHPAHALTSLVLATLVLTLFYGVFFPQRVRFRHLLTGSFVTALLWQMLRPAFNAFLHFNPEYGWVFGSLKYLFVSVAWLYITFVVFLFGTALISTLRSKEALLLKDLLLGGEAGPAVHHVAARLGEIRRLEPGDTLFRSNEPATRLYYLLKGRLVLSREDAPPRIVEAGELCGEPAMLKGASMDATAVAVGNCELLAVSPEHLEDLLRTEPRVAQLLLKALAERLWQPKGGATLA